MKITHRKVEGSMKKVILSFVVLAALLSCLDANVFTMTGEMRVPNAYVLPSKAAKIQFINYMRKEESRPGEDFEYVPMGMLQVGGFNRAELGFMGTGDEFFVLHAKVSLVEETVTVPQVAIGVDNILSTIKEDANKYPIGHEMRDNPDRVYWEKNSPYVVFSKQSVISGLFGIPSISTVFNAGFGRNRFIGQVKLTKKMEGVFGSVEFSPMLNLKIITEMDGHNINIGARYDVKNFSFKAGMLGLDESLKSDNPNTRLGLSVAYLFDKYADARKSPYRPGSPLPGGPASPTGEQILKPETTATQSSSNELLEELRRLRESREQAAKVLDELRQQLQDLEKEASGQ